MLLSLSHLLARAKRAGKTVLNCIVTTPEMVKAVLVVAERHNLTLAITIDFTVAHTFEASTLLDISIHLAQLSSAGICFIVGLPANEKTMREVITKGINAVYFHLGTHSLVRRKELTAWAVVECHAHNVAVIGDISHGATPLKVSVFVQETGIQALFIPLHTPGVETAAAMLTPEYLHQLALAAKIPLVLPAINPTMALLAQLKKSGVGMVTISDELEEAYTAGLRAGLHSRSEHRISVYQARALKGVETTLERYLDVTLRTQSKIIT